MSPDKRKKRKKTRRTFVRRGRMLLAAVVLLAAIALPAGRKKTQKQEWTGENPAADQQIRETAVTANGDAMNTADYPESLLDFMDKYPEATQFVMDWPLYCGSEQDMDISEDLVNGGYPLFLQWDRRWGYETYGDDFMAVNGCGPTCLSMVYCGLTGRADENPYQVAQMAEQNGYFVDGVGSSWDLMDKGAEKLDLAATAVGADEEQICSALYAGSPVICSVMPGDFTYQGHFIVLAGINSDGTVQVLDPNSKINSEKSWSMEQLLPQIAGAWSYCVNYVHTTKRP